MRSHTSNQGTPSTAKAVGIGVLVVGVYWAAFGALTVAILRPVETTAVAQRLPPSDPKGRAVEANRPPQTVRFRNVALVPIGRPVSLDQAKIGFVGQTAEGFGLWSVKPSGGTKSRGGGGGGDSVPRGVPEATGPVYLRTTDNHWWQVVQQNER